MPRIRTVKPEFWVSEQVIACSPNARLLFIGLWNFCDDGGVHSAEYVRLKAEIFPADSFTTQEIKTWINELISNNLLREYVVEDKPYWIVTGWRHQKINRPTPLKYPQPISRLTKVDEHSLLPQRGFTELSMNPHAIDSGKGKDMEGSGKEINICEVETSPAGIHQSFCVHEIFEHWKIVMHHPNAKLDDKRQYRIKNALKKGYTVEQLKQAINGCANTAHNMGKNDSNQRYDDITLILRDAEHIERFMNNAFLQPIAGSDSEWMAGVI